MDKKEYIERDALIKKIMERREMRSSGEEPPEVELIRRVDHNDFIFMAAHQPAANVAEVSEIIDKVKAMMDQFYTMAIHNVEYQNAIEYDGGIEEVFMEIFDDINDELDKIAEGYKK